MLLRTVLSHHHTVRTAQAASAWRALSSASSSRAPPRSGTASTAAAGGPTAPPAAPSPGTDALLELLEDVENSTPAGAVQELQNPRSILRHLTRHQVISPQHLSPRTLLVPYPPRPNLSLAHPLGPSTALGPTHDPFIRYGLDPLRDAATNPWVLAEFVTGMGKIKSRGKTGLQRKSQRRVGKAVRRARSMGILPTFGISVPGPGGNY